MNQQNTKSVKSSNAKSIDAAKEVLFGTTGIAILSTAAVGVAGYLIWKNREQIKSFVSQYVDLPEFIAGEESEDSLNTSKSSNLGAGFNANASTNTAHRM